MLKDSAIFLGSSVCKGAPNPQYLNLRLANRHGLITGASGTGKTVTLQVLAEGFSAAGVPVFAADIKGDLSGIALPGSYRDYLVDRARDIGLVSQDAAGVIHEAKSFPFASGHPSIFYDVFREEGLPIRATVRDIGPILMSRMLEVSGVQEGVLNIAFRLADDEKLPLGDLDDLRRVLASARARSDELAMRYGAVSASSVAAIQRSLLVLESQGGNQFLSKESAEPFDIMDLMLTCETTGKGYVSLLSAERLMQSPRLYSAFMLWLLTKLWNTLPEVGDLDRPKLVFFFDEAHLMFNGARRSLLERIEQIARLIRSKGVGIYFITQSPLDVPDSVSGQLGNRVQHALRAFTPREQRAIRAAAETFRANPHLDTRTAISEMRVGEALVSTLEGRGAPSMVQRTLIRPPVGQIGPINDVQRQLLIETSPVFEKYRDRPAPSPLPWPERAPIEESASEIPNVEPKPRRTVWDALFGDGLVEDIDAARRG